MSPTELKTRVADTLRGDSVAVRTGEEEADRQEAMAAEDAQILVPDPAAPRHIVTVRGLGYKLQR